MMKIKALFAAAAVCLLGQFASAQTTTVHQDGPLWVCNLDFAGQARGFQVIVGKFEIRGKGTLDCYAPNGEAMSLPVKVKMYSGPVAARIAFGAYDVYGSSADLSLFSNSPMDLIGDYLVAQAQGSVIAGAGIITGARVGLPDITLTLSLQVLKGLGLNFGVTSMTVSLDQARL